MWVDVPVPPKDTHLHFGVFVFSIFLGLLRISPGIFLRSFVLLSLFVAFLGSRNKETEETAFLLFLIHHAWPHACENRHHRYLFNVGEISMRMMGRGLMVRAHLSMLAWHLRGYDYLILVSFVLVLAGWWRGMEWMNSGKGKCEEALVIILEC